MEVINSGMRKSIKILAVTAQTAQFISLMPTPEEFVTRLVGDMVYLSSQITRISDELNRMLDEYSEIPGNYLMTQMNSITGSMVGINNRLNIFGQNAVNQTIGLGENSTEMISELTGTVIDTTGSVINAITGIASAVTQTGADVLGQTDFASDVHGATEIIFEWTDNQFQTINENTTTPLNNITKKLDDVRVHDSSKIGDKAAKTDKIVGAGYHIVETLITKLRGEMKKLQSTIDVGFRDLTGMDSTALKTDEVIKELQESGDNSKEAQLTIAAMTTFSEIVKNFNIGKVAGAFAGILVQSSLVRHGLDELPPIDFESMLYKISGDLSKSSDDLYKDYKKLNRALDNEYNEYIKFGEGTVSVPSEDRNYSADNYNEFVKTYDEDIIKKRENIMNLMKNPPSKREGGVSDAVTGKDITGKVDTLAKREIRSAIDEVNNFRKKIKNAKHANTYRSILGNELDNFFQEARYRYQSLTSDWQSMLDQYGFVISEIKSFFSGGGSCDLFVDDCCNAINKDFNDIKELCKNLTSQLIGCSIKIVMPADIGTVVPNPAYKLADFWMDIKTIFKFIKDIITLLIDIFNNLNKLVRIITNGIRSAKEILNQLMDMLDLEWLLELVENIIDLFGDNITNAKDRLINTLSPVHFNETTEYDNAMEALESLMENHKLSSQQKEYLADVSSMLSGFEVKKKEEKDMKNLISNIDSAKSANISSENDEEKVGEWIEDLEDQGERIVAYKSPIIRDVGKKVKVSDLVDGADMDCDVKFIGWYFFHPNLSHTGNTYYKSKFMKKIKSRLLRRASRTGHKLNGGVNKLHNKKIGRKSTHIDEAYNAFYWYTYYTEDLEKDCYERMAIQGNIIIDSVVRTENGSIVELSDGRKVFVADNSVKSGDYVNVDGVKYRVK